jgi:hypothetical protein
MPKAIGNPSTIASLLLKIDAHERNITNGRPHYSACRCCQADSTGFKRLRIRQRKLRFIDFNPASQSHVVKSIKLNIARYLCTRCGYRWVDYPDFRTPV